MPFERASCGRRPMMAGAPVLACLRPSCAGYSGFGFSALVIAASGLVTNPLNFVAVVVILRGGDVACRLAEGVGARCGLAAGLAAAGRGGGGAAAGAVGADLDPRGCGAGGDFGLCAGDVPGPAGAAGASGRGCGAGNGCGGSGVGPGQCAGDGRAAGGGVLCRAADAGAVFRATLVAYFPLLDIYSGAAVLVDRSGQLGHALGRALVACRWCSWATGWAGGISVAPIRRISAFAIVLLAVLALLGLVKAVL